MAITAEQIYLLNKMNMTAQRVGLGDLINEAGNVSAGEITLANGSILIGNVSNVAAANAVSGDITLSNTGVAAIAAGVIVNADVNASAAIAYSKLALSNSIVAGDLTAGSVTLAKLASGVAPSHVVKYAGTFTTAGGDALESISVPGVVGTDLAFVVVKTKGGTPVSIVEAAAGTDAIAVTLSADPSTDHVLAYQVLRAAS